jgi:integrase
MTIAMRLATLATVPVKSVWHTFRHSFGTLLKANGEDVKTVQELLRHANSRITLDVYTQAVNSNKREAQSKVVRMMVLACPIFCTSEIVSVAQRSRKLPI